ncbi:hypothetical protein ACJJTC_010665 [Scirpophaga incertulas]
MSQKTVTIRQLELLLDFMQEHTDLALGRVRSKEGRALSQRLWAKLADILNGDAPENSFRSAKEWNKFYTDYKCRVKAKARKLALSQRKTGGGGADAPPLTALEERLCGIIAPHNFDPLPVQINPVPELIEPPMSINITGDMDFIEPSTSWANMEAETGIIDVQDLDIVIETSTPQAQSKSPTQEPISTPVECNHSKKKSVPAKHRIACTSSSNIEKTKELLGKLEQAKIEALREQTAVMRERNEIEKEKAKNIGILASAMSDLANILATQKKKYQYRYHLQ